MYSSRQVYQLDFSSRQGMQSIHKFIRGRRVPCTKMDIVSILSSENPFISKLSQPAQDAVFAMGQWPPLSCIPKRKKFMNTEPMLCSS